MNEEKFKDKPLVSAFIDNFKYAGYLIDEDDLVYKIFDIKDNCQINLPRKDTTLKYKNG